VWTSDITYIWTTEGWAYVSTFIDLGSRRVLGACFADNMATPMVVAALESALKAARPPKGLVVHSDQGSQYNSASYRSTLEHHGLLGSMSSKGECWDNAPTESFWSIMKREICAKEGFRTRDEAFAAVQKWLTYYNEERPHSALGGLSPAAYEAGLATTRAQRRRLKLRSGLTLLKDCSETR
jgi:transposase InsO family protein